jgi:hypothetical protein
MARPTRRLIDALHETIARIDSGASYQWGNMGACNCGHLAQSLTDKSRAEIHAAALRRAGDWGQQSIDYCPTSGLPLDDIITIMLEAGLEPEDMDRLERLNDRAVLARIPLEERWLERNNRAHAVRYMREWVSLLEEQLAELEAKRVDLDAARPAPPKDGEDRAA